MVDPNASPGEVHADAKQRAWRTFLQGLLATVLSVLGAFITIRLADIQWTREWWLATAGALVTVVITAALSYVGRFLVPPKPAP